MRIWRSMPPERRRIQSAHRIPERMHARWICGGGGQLAERSSDDWVEAESAVWRQSWRETIVAGFCDRMRGRVRNETRWVIAVEEDIVDGA